MTPKIKFGPAGLGSVKEAIENLQKYNERGLRACEIAFTYGIYIKDKKDIEEIKKSAEENNIQLSIHAPYWVNLNSKEKHKVEQTKMRILKCCEVGEKLGAEIVVFHPGYYSDMDEEQTFQNIKKAIQEMQKILRQNNWKIKLAPETMGKINVFGNIEQISRLAKETGCEFCLDFAHIEAREKKVDYDKIKKLFPQKNWHCHFSGIVYGEKGERHHIKTPKEKWKELLENLPKDRNITIINESPEPVEDSVEGLRIMEKL